jgi:hypothetical protein
MMIGGMSCKLLCSGASRSAEGFELAEAGVEGANARSALGCTQVTADRPLADQLKRENRLSFSLAGGHNAMKYAYEVQSDATKTVHAFSDEASRVQWIAASPSARCVLSGNSKEVKGALYRETVISTCSREKEI